MPRQNQAEQIRRLKRRIEAGEYRLSDHALTEMDDDDIHEVDMLHAVANSRKVRRLTGDVRGPRYLFVGPTPDGRKIEVVCREAGVRVRIITVYVVE